MPSHFDTKAKIAKIGGSGDEDKVRLEITLADGTIRWFEHDKPFTVQDCATALRVFAGTLDGRFR